MKAEKVWDANLAYPQPGPKPTSDAVVTAPSLHIPLFRLHPHGVEHESLHVMAAQFGVAVGAPVIAQPGPRLAAASDAVVLAPRRHSFAFELQPHGVVHALLHVIALQASPAEVGADVAPAGVGNSVDSQPKPAANSEDDVRPPNMHAFALRLQPQTPLHSRAHVTAEQPHLSQRSGQSMSKNPANSPVQSADVKEVH